MCFLRIHSLAAPSRSRDDDARVHVCIQLHSQTQPLQDTRLHNPHSMLHHIVRSISFPFSHSRLPIPSDLVQKKHISQFSYFAPPLFSYSSRRVLINQARKSRHIRKIGKTCTEKDARALALGFIVAAWFSMKGYQQVRFFRGTYRVSPWQSIGDVWRILNATRIRTSESGGWSPPSSSGWICTSSV